MLLNPKVAFLMLLIGLSPCKIALGQGDAEAKVSLKQELATAMAKARQGEFQAAFDLRRRFTDLRILLQPYVTDKSDNVRLAVALIASEVKSREAILVLAQLMDDTNSSAALQAVKTIFTYDCSQVREWGDGRLRTNLIRYMRDNKDSAEAVLLLSCFPDDAQVKELLLRRARTGAAVSTRLDGLGASPTVEMSFCISIALAQLGDVDALASVRLTLAEGAVDRILFIFQAISIVSSPDILVSVVNTLKDQRKARNVGPVGGTPIYLRVCDVAYRALKFKAGETEFLDLWSGGPLTDDELKAAFETYSRRFGAK